MNELVKVDMSEYGLTETKAKEVKQVFDVVLATASELEDEYNRVAALEISPETCAAAKALRLKYVKVRTGIAKAHKEQKAFFLSGGRAVDGLKNAYTHAVQGNEEKLKEIEAHYDRIEEAKLAELQAERATALDPYVDNAFDRVLSGMEDDVFAALLFTNKTQFEERVAAELKVEEDRIAKEKADAEDRQRIETENARLKAEADEREKKEDAAQFERDRIEDERIKADKDRADKEQAERDRLEAIRVEAETLRLKTEADARKALEAIADNERATRERIESEAKAKADAEKKQAAEDAARAKDTEHRRMVNRAILEALTETGIDDDQAKAVLKAIYSGRVPNVSITY